MPISSEYCIGYHCYGYILNFCRYKIVLYFGCVCYNFLFFSGLNLYIRANLHFYISILLFSKMIKTLLFVKNPFFQPLIYFYACFRATFKRRDKAITMSGIWDKLKYYSQFAEWRLENILIHTRSEERYFLSSDSKNIKWIDYKMYIFVTKLLRIQILSFVMQHCFGYYV